MHLSSGDHWIHSQEEAFSLAQAYIADSKRMKAIFSCNHASGRHKVSLTWTLVVVASLLLLCVAPQRQQSEGNNDCNCLTAWPSWDPAAMGIDIRTYRHFKGYYICAARLGKRTPKAVLMMARSLVLLMMVLAIYEALTTYITASGFISIFLLSLVAMYASITWVHARRLRWSFYSCRSSFSLFCWNFAWVQGLMS